MQHQPISPFLPNIRRRVDRICKDCHCLKEKCMGTTPCDRCKRLGRSSQFTNRFRRVSIYRTHLNIPDKVSMATISPDDALVYFEMERIQALEYIVRHYTGLQRYDRQALEDTITGISSSYEVLPQMDENQDDGSRSEDTASTANADLSYDEVSLHIQRDTNDGMDKFKSEISRSDTAVSEAGTNSYSPSARDAILEAASLFPPAPSALVLLRVFLEFAQTNYFYIDEESLRQRLDQFYSCTSQLEAEDAPWVSVVLMVFALGVQYSNHYQSLTRDSCRELMRDAHDICQSMDDSIASKLYQGAIKKIPDILAIESIESVQAFLLFGLFMLPVDPAGLSYTYFGIAIKLATQQNLHRKTESIMSSRELGVGKRVWWTAYALERRISVLYGRPVSISRADINADLPVDTEDLQPKERINTFQNNMAMLKINIFMEDARDGVAALMNSNNTIQSNDFQNIIHLKERISIHWRSLSEQTFCRDLAPGKPLFRSNVHLALNYHLLHILMGKYFISDSLNPEASCATDIGWPMVRAKLVNDCIDSAVAIVYLCHMLRREKYLSKLSHTELSSCYSAVMALVASCVYDEDDRLRDACEKGMKVLQEISTGLSSAGFGKHVGESLEYEFDKSNHGKKKSTGGLDGDGYKQFQKWVALQEIAPREGPQPPSQEDTTVRE